MKVKSFLLAAGIAALIVSSSGCGTKSDEPVNSPNVEVSVQPSVSPEGTNDTTKDQGSKVEEKGMQAFESSTHKIKIKYPEGWSKMENYMGAVAAFLAPKENANALFQSNFNIMVQDLSAQPMTLKQYTELSLEQIGKLITNSKIEVSEDTTIGGKPGYKVAYKGEQGQLKLEYVSVYTIQDNKAYLITFTCEQDKYSEYTETIDKVVDSFEFM